MSDATVVFGPYALDLRRSVLTKNGQLAPLHGRSLEILCALARAGSEPVAKNELLARIWPGASVGENNLHVHISELRKFLGEAGRAYLVTVPGFGYQLLASETVAAPPEASGGRPTLAIMEFRSLSGGAAGQNFADGLTEELITRWHGAAPSAWSPVIFRGRAKATPVGPRSGSGLATSWRAACVTTWTALSSTRG